MKKSSAPNQITRKAHKTDRPNLLSTWVAAGMCGLILLSGFFFAAHQHFSSMEYGIKNSSLRRKLEDLRAEKQRLLYTREVSVSPNEIKRAAKKAGIFESPTTAPTVGMASAKRESKPNRSMSAELKPTVIKTGSVVPVAPRTQRALETVALNEKPKKGSISR